MDNKLNDIRIVRILLWNLCVKAGKTVFQIFLNIFIWKQTQSIQAVAMFNIIYLSVHTIWYLVFGPIAKKWYRNILHFMSLIWYACVYLWIMYLGTNAVNHLILIPIGIGFFNSMYWITYHNTQFDITHYKNRWKYEWIRRSSRMFASIVIPVVVWFFITFDYMWYGYQMAFSFWALLFFIWAFVGVVDIHVDNKEKYNLLEVTKQCLWNKDVFRSLYTHTLSAFSFSNSVIEVIIPIILFTYLQEEFDLGVLVSIFSIVSMLAMYLFWKFVDYKHYKKAVFTFGFTYGFVLLWFIVLWEIQYLVILSALLTSIAALYSLPQKVISDNILHKLKNYKNIRSEYMVLRELFMSIGWIGMYVILYMIDSIERDKIWILFVFMVACVFLSAYQLSKVDISKQEK